ncbi:MAG TPA: AAA family ATPase, partial [Anaerolineales bacterium]|nr:AAA family ATPase [Anaerolineales bacterium]
VQNDLILLLTERFETIHQPVESSETGQSHPPTNLPVPRNPLIDRDKELTEIRSLIQRDDVALVTLTGPGGTGKSRTALHIGQQLLDYFPDGVYLVRLETLNDPKLIVFTIAEVFGLHETQGGRPITEMLREFLRDKKMLLILDNFEHLLDAATRVAELLEACPKLKCIATSRTPLRLRAERELPIPPLRVPAMQKNEAAESLSQFSAVELFIQRAQAVRPEFSVTNANAPAVAEICFRLDGLPLAIELAAVRIKLFSPDGLLSRLEHGFDLLTGGTRDLPERQRTLRGAIDWSYNLLNDNERRLFRRLSVFTGGCSLQSAELVCNIQGDLGPRMDDLMTSLIDNSLVIQHEDADGEPRFGMLSTLHEYAVERLKGSDEDDTVHQQLAQYLLDFVKDVEPRTRSAERARWQQVMLQEHANVRGILEWITGSGKFIDIGQQIVIAVGLYWLLGGYLIEGRQWCDKMLALCDEQTPETIRAALLCYDGQLTWTQGDQISAVASMDQSIGLLRKHGDSVVLAIALTFRGVIASATRDLDLASALYQESLQIFKANHEQWYEAITLSWLGDVVLYQGDANRAKSMHQESIRLARLVGDPWCIMPALMTTAEQALIAGDLDTAQKNLNEVVEGLYQIGDHWSLSWTLLDLVHVAFLQDDLEQARSNLLEGLSMAKTMGNIRALVVALAQAAALISKRTQSEVAELTLAANLCGATAKYLDTPGIFVWFDTKNLYDEAITLVKTAMQTDLWNLGYSEGVQIPIDEAVALAIKALGRGDPDH